MYDMYPDSWLADQRRQPLAVADHPRRRARKTHSVLPPVLTVDVDPRPLALERTTRVDPRSS